MGLKADIDEVTAIWHRAAWRVRAFLALSFFLSTSSIASLSEAVFKWKGFALDALTFHRSYIARPLGECLQRLLSHPVPTEALDSTIILTMFFAGAARVMIYRQKSAKSKVLDLSTFLVCYLGMLYLLVNPSKGSEVTSASSTSAWLLYPVFLLWFYLSLKGAERILAISYMLAPVLAVAIIGAVSSGFSR